MPASARLREILEASTRSSRDPFEVLDVEPTEDEAVLRQAYVRLVRVLYPDAALDPSLDDLRGLRERAFVQLGQAYKTLRNPADRRKAFETASRTRGKAPRATAPPEAKAPLPPEPAPATQPKTRPPENTEAVVATAQRHFAKEQYWDAIQLLEPLLPRTEGTLRVKAQMLLARSYRMNPRWAKRAEETVLDLLHESPRYVPGQILLGDIYRASGLVARARTAYQRALALQPDNETAAGCLAELPPEASPEPAPAGGLRGVFRRR